MSREHSPIRNSLDGDHRSPPPHREGAAPRRSPHPLLERSANATPARRITGADQLAAALSSDNALHASTATTADEGNQGNTDTNPAAATADGNNPHQATATTANAHNRGTNS